MSADDGLHTWGVAVVSDLTDEQAAELAQLDLPERLAQLGRFVGEPRAVRGPICQQCRVHWRDVYRQPSKPWPCPGRRPDSLGGPLLPAEVAKPRQQTRAERRAAQRTHAQRAQRKDEGLDASVVAAMAASRRAAAERRQVQDDYVAGWAALGEALADADTTDYFAPAGHAPAGIT